MTKDTIQKEEGGGLLDPIWSYVLGDEGNDSFYTGTDTDTGKSFDSIGHSFDDDRLDTTFTEEGTSTFENDYDDTDDDDDEDDDDDDEYNEKEPYTRRFTGGSSKYSIKNKNNTSRTDTRAQVQSAADKRRAINFVSKERYDEAVQALSLYQTLAEERLKRNEDLMNEVARVQTRTGTNSGSGSGSGNATVLPPPPTPFTRSISWSNNSRKSVNTKISTTSKRSQSTKQSQSIPAPAKLGRQQSGLSKLTSKMWPSSNNSRKEGNNNSNSVVSSSDRRSDNEYDNDDDDESSLSREETDRWEWELDPEIFPHSGASCGNCCGSRGTNTNEKSTNKKSKADIKKQKNKNKKLIAKSKSATTTTPTTPTTTTASASQHVQRPTVQTGPTTTGSTNKKNLNDVPKKRNLLQKLVCRTSPLVVAERANSNLVVSTTTTTRTK